MTGMAAGLSGSAERDTPSSKRQARRAGCEASLSCFHLLGAAATLRPVGLSRGSIVVLFGVARFRLQDFPSDVVAVLLVVEEPPPFVEWPRNLRPKQTVHGRVAVGQMPAGDLVVAVVLKTRFSTELRIQSCRGIAPFGKDPDRLVGRVAVVDIHVEEERRIERVALRVKSVAGIFDENDVVCIPKSAVVKSRMRDIGAIQQGQYSGIPGQPKPEQGPESAKRRTRLGQRVGVASGVEDEFREIRSWTELSVLRALEGCA